MSTYQDSKVKFNGAIDKLSEEIDKLTKKAQRATELEAQNQKLQENNSHLENEIKILKSDFLEKLANYFDQTDTPYTSELDPINVPPFKPYQHLSRSREWLNGDNADE